MKTIIIDLLPLRTSIMSLLDQHRDRLTLDLDMAHEDRLSIEEARMEAKKTERGSDERAKYFENVKSTVYQLLHSLVLASLRSHFRYSTTSSYNSAYEDIISSMLLPEYSALQHFDDDDTSLLDEALVLFDDVYCEAMELFNNLDCNPFAIITFDIYEDTLKVREGEDIRIAIANVVFDNNWKGPQFNLDGSLSTNATFAENEYLSKVRAAAS